MEEKTIIGTAFNPEKMYTYLRGYASGAGMKETLKALSFARDKHSGQLRKSGEPYIVHPLTMACNAVSMGIKKDAVIATILLHDVCEDCGVSLAGTFSVEKLKSYIEETRHYVLPLLRKVKTMYPEESDILFVLKYYIISVVDSIDAAIQVFEAEK